MTAGALAGDVTDRILASHALNFLNADGSNSATAPATPNNGSDGKPLFADVPPTTGSYTGLFNATAILAPMNATRWLVGVGAPIALYALSMAFSSKGSARAILQLGAFGWGVRTLLKGANQAAASLFGRSQMGARLFDAEARASAAQVALASGSTTDNRGLYPSSGLGSARCDCPNCVAGVGACCASSMNQALANQTGGYGPTSGYAQPPQSLQTGGGVMTQPSGGGAGTMQPVQGTPSSGMAPGQPHTISPGNPTGNLPAPGGGPTIVPAPGRTAGIPVGGQTWQGIRGVPRQRARSPYAWAEGIHDQ